MATQDSKCYLESLLEKRELEECPLPLWKLKLTDDEFEGLRKSLELRTHLCNVANPFLKVRKDCALFFAEYWRRSYVEGSHSKQMVYDALGSTMQNADLCEEFYEAAKSGADSLRIERYKGKKSDTLNDLLYQGGLPMKLVVASDTNSVWDRFARGLVNRKIDFDELELGQVASQSKSLNDFCSQLIDAIEKSKYELMPFYCEGSDNLWYVRLKDIERQETRRKSLCHPFTLRWEFDIDQVEGKIDVKYIVGGATNLPASFIEQQGLGNVPFFSVQVMKDGKAEDSFDYVNNFCRYDVRSKRRYREGEEISVFVHNNKEPYLRGVMDMLASRLLYRNKDGMFETGNRLGSVESFLLIPTGWEICKAANLEPRMYRWGDTELTGIDVPSDYLDEIVIASGRDTVTFQRNMPQYWTEAKSSPLLGFDVIEPIYDVNKCDFALCHETEDSRISEKCRVQYRSRWQNDWTTIPEYGKIFVRAIDRHNFVAPISVINVGSGLSISLQRADEDSCRIKVVWPHGHVSIADGEKKIDDVWEIKKENCSDPHKIEVVFTPRNNSNNRFTLTLRAPFKGFSITDDHGRRIKDNSVIPFADIDKYQYHLVGQGIRRYTYGDEREKREIRWTGAELHVMSDGRKLRSIPYHGSLVTLLDSREQVHALLEKTSKNLVDAEIKVKMAFIDGQKFSFSIKESPYFPKQVDDGRVIVEDSNHGLVVFTGTLKLFKLDEPTHDPVIMKYNEETGAYVLPEAIRDWGKTLLVGQRRGRIRPALVNLSAQLDDDYRKRNYEETKATIKEGLSTATLGDNLWNVIFGWFEKSQIEDIPASSILELVGVAEDYKSLLRMAYILYIQTKADERDMLRDRLMSFSKDLAFQWYWLLPYLGGMVTSVEPFIGQAIESGQMKTCYINWALAKGEEGAEAMKALFDPNLFLDYVVRFVGETATSFEAWMKELAKSSMLDAYDTLHQEHVAEIANYIINKEKYRIELSDEDYIESNQQHLRDSTLRFFSLYDEPGKRGNELWLCQRVNAVVAHMQKKIDLFQESDEIRRSIIYCYKSQNYHFIILLNNKLNNEI